MAIDRGTTIEYSAGDDRIRLASDAEPDAIDIALPVAGDPRTITPAWGRYVAAIASELGSTQGITGSIRSNIPAGAGLSSSAALECAVGLALGFDGTPTDLALAAQRAEHAATGVPDRDHGSAVHRRCHRRPRDDDRLPHARGHPGSGSRPRSTWSSSSSPTAHWSGRPTPTVWPSAPGPRPSSVRSETPPSTTSNEPATTSTTSPGGEPATSSPRTNGSAAFASALGGGDYARAGRLMHAGHESLRSDFETSTPAMDAAVERLTNVLRRLRGPDDRRRFRRLRGRALSTRLAQLRLDRARLTRRAPPLTRAMSQTPPSGRFAHRLGGFR